MGEEAGSKTQCADTLHWRALFGVCLGVMMIVIDTTVVNVALSSIQKDLQFADNSLIWVVNAYMLTFGGLLALSGRLGDCFGHRRLFFAGIALFCIASLACGSASTQIGLISARAVQGAGGAVVLAAALSLIMSMFTTSDARARAIGIYGAVCASGGSIGVLLGGVLTSSLGWHWVFFVNVPIGIVVFAMSVRQPDCATTPAEGQLDLWGAVVLTALLMIANYAIVSCPTLGWASPQMLWLLGGSLVLLIAFLFIETMVPTPLIPLRIFSDRNFATSNVIRVLWAAGMSTWSFVSVLNMQIVFQYDPMQIGMAFLPANITMAACSCGLSARLVIYFGVKKLLCFGLLLMACGFSVSALISLCHHNAVMVLGLSMFLVGLGGGLALSPLLLASMSTAEPTGSGVISGIVNTVSLMGGAIGLAVFATVAAVRTTRLLASGTSEVEALAAGYRLALLLSAACAAGAALLTLTLLLSRKRSISGASVVSTTSSAQQTEA